MAKEKSDQEKPIQEVINKLESLRQILMKKEKPFMSIDETSDYLGISKNTLYGYTSKGILPFYKPQNRKIFFKIEDINQFVLDKKNKISSNKEIEEKAVTKIVTEGGK